MRRLSFVLVLFAALIVPVAASADTPAPTAVAACQAEYAQLGADAFVAKYGPTEPWGHCYQQHAPSAPPTTTSDANPAVAACEAEYGRIGRDAFSAKYGAANAAGLANCVSRQNGAATTPTTDDDPAAAACKAEYLQLGPAAFAAKYGTPETFGNCVKAHTASPPPPPKQTDTRGAATSVAVAFCQNLAKTRSKQAMGNCVKAALANAKALVAGCAASSGSNKDTFRACLAAGLPPRR